ncbi:DUF3107 domain-containing protein [Corynebacterium heidelbergense]|uniref:DUF3107 domain-containing protein n=1 Tax=Corynebacterium heidelbergense TaxID=2055947 RepID=A0A364V9X1_9CORY|nr:DUF3107 domain-containing protein [Corynebacterium heidelbergense]RAV33414.1 DUF3107 domain-containing protein [Corynebacterium heidelbergense]WCZ37168.1 hypothetical protein CHEID_08190 [Corynebacterium heidelbergense]
MQIKIGLVHNPRELLITSDKSQEEILPQLEQFLAAAEDNNATTTLEDSKGSKFILSRPQVAYIEVGTSERRSVGFI